jgi:hypothetical protein
MQRKCPKKIPTIWKLFHRSRKVGVGIGVFGDPFPDFWKNVLEIQLVNLFDGKLIGHGKL